MGDLRPDQPLTIEAIDGPIVNRIRSRTDLSAWEVMRLPVGRAIVALEASFCAHSSDFRSVVWSGKSYKFTPTQAACIAELWLNWERGTPDVGEQTILDRVDSNQQRLIKVFASGQHRAWREMIVAGASKGTFCLSELK